MLSVITARAPGLTVADSDGLFLSAAALNVFGSIDIYLEVVRFDLQTDLDTASLGLRLTF